MLLSFREVSQLSQRSFSAAGYSQGTARAYADVVRWTEAYKGSGIKVLHKLVDDLPELEASTASLSRRHTAFSMIESDGQPILTASVPALDLSCADARGHGIGVAHATTSAHDVSLATTGYAAYKAAERGFVSLVFATGRDGTSRTVFGTPDDPYPLVAEVDQDALSASQVEVLQMVDSGLDVQRDNLFVQSFFAGDGENRHFTADARLVHRLFQRSIEPAADVSRSWEPSYTVLCVDPYHPGSANVATSVVESLVEDRHKRFDQVYRPESTRERVSSLIQEGVAVDRERWRELLDFSRERYAPDFEGSVAEAGFGLGE